MSESNQIVRESDTEQDMQSLRDRMHVYESFDSIIAEQVARAKAFVQEAAEMRERTTREIANDRRQFERELARRSAEFNAEIAESRRQVHAHLLQLATTAEALQQFTWPTSPVIATEADIDIIEAVDEEAILPIEKVAESVEDGPILTDVSIEAPLMAETPQVHIPEPEPQLISLEPEAPPVFSEPVRITIIFHGIHKPAIATGLQRYLLAQDGISTVEPREFAEGILRLQVRTSTQIDENLFAGWADGAGLTVTQRLPQTVEVHLPVAG